MPKFNANLSMLFTEAPFPDRFAAAAEAGFRGVEYLFPYAFEKDDIAERLHKNGLTQVLFNLPAGDWEEESAASPAIRIAYPNFRTASARPSITQRPLIALRSIALPGSRPRAWCRSRATDARGKSEVRRIETAGCGHYSFRGAGQHLRHSRLLPEPLRAGIALFDEVGSPNLKLQYDIYHMQRMEGELANTIERLLPRIAHIQLADNPGRNEPGTGEINYPFLLNSSTASVTTAGSAANTNLGMRTKEGLGWMQAYR